jgi:hypothetical protein
MLHTLLSLRSALGAFIYIYIIVQGARLECCVFAPGQTNALNGGKLKGKLEGYGMATDQTQQFISPIDGAPNREPACIMAFVHAD